MCVRVAVAIGLFRSIADCNGLEGISAEEMAKISESDKRLIGTSPSPRQASQLQRGQVRIMWILTAGGYAAEAASDRYLPTPITTAMTVLSVEASIKHR